MVKRKKMRGSIVVARADRIYRCLLEGLRTTGRGKLPFAPAYEAPRSSFRFERIIPIEIYSDSTKFPLLGRDFLLSSKSIRAKHPSSSYPPRHTLRNFHPSLETSVRMNFAKALIYEQPCSGVEEVFFMWRRHMLSVCTYVIGAPRTVWIRC